MTLKQCYELLEGDYEDVLGRMRKEALVEKFVLKFLNDSSFETLRQGIATRDRETAFRAAHTIKGVAQNLGCTKLCEVSNLLTEELRQDWGESVAVLVRQVEAVYERTTAAILAYKEECAYEKS